jgi:hypothetical protein
MEAPNAMLGHLQQLTPKMMQHPAKTKKFLCASSD